MTDDSLQAIPVQKIATAHCIAHFRYRASLIKFSRFHQPVQ
jgi:hypothetical protein